MGDTWFTSVSKDHFWIKRRFQILKKLFGKELESDIVIAEIGSGTGLVQKQIEDSYDREVDGMDLNQNALNQSVVEKSNSYCYNIYDKNETFKKKYDAILLMDVLEHIDDESKFLDSINFMLKKNGYLVINVPAFQTLYSVYDKKVGHVRRYNFKSLDEITTKNGYSMMKWSYWGFSMIPLLLIRRFILMFVKEENIIDQGMSTNSNLSNSLLGFWSKLEFIPQKIAGSSLLAVLKNNNQK